MLPELFFNVSSSFVDGGLAFAVLEAGRSLRSLALDLAERLLSRGSDAFCSMYSILKFLTSAISFITCSISCGLLDLCPSSPRLCPECFEGLFLLLHGVGDIREALARAGSHPSSPGTIIHVAS
jgi:hypothetical protein